MTAGKKRAGVGAAGIAVLAVVCCAGLPLLLAAGLSVAVLAWVGGIAVGAIGLAAAFGLLALRARQRRAAACAGPGENAGRTA